MSETTREIKVPIGLDIIEEHIPHRFPFRFLDEIVVFEDRVRAVGKYTVTGEEDLFRGHFPGRPIFPGVIMLEALAQLGVFFAKYCTGGTPPDRLIVFMGADEVRFRKAVVPGDTLFIGMQNWKKKGRFWKLDGEIKVKEDVVMTATISAAEID